MYKNCYHFKLKIRFLERDCTRTWQLTRLMSRNFFGHNFEILCLDSNNEWWRCFYSRLNYFFTAAVVSEFIVQHTFEIIAIFVEFLVQQQAWKTFVDKAK